MLLRFLRAIVFMGFLAVVLQGTAGFLSRKLEMEPSYTEIHLTAALVLGFVISWLYKKGLDYNELKEDKDG